MNVAIFFPVLAHFVLVIGLLLVMGWLRRQALLTREVRLSEIALDETAWPDSVRKFANCYRNQFELPVVFYVLCILAYVTGHADVWMIALAWAFVLSRFAHAYIHTTSNIVARRGAVFALGFLIIALMIVVLFLRLTFAQA